MTTALHPFELAIEPLYKVAASLVTGIKKVTPKFLVEFLKEQATFLCLVGVLAIKLAQTLVGDKNMLGEFCNACERGNMGGKKISRPRRILGLF